MQRSIFRPIPALDDLAVTETKEKRIQTIIDNLARHQQEVRASVLRDVQRRISNESPAAMDIDTDDQSEERENQNFIKNASTALPEGAPDPCLSHGTIVPMNPAVRQAVVPANFQRAQEAIEQVEAYDQNARRLREYYGRALERQKASRT
ncbi:hypothetical protein LTR86_000722 [Recurvomyces mirabilis]|nr:hypothetical protein LTR86_000722 [Recurvomyces mirabilis]